MRNIHIEFGMIPLECAFTISNLRRRRVRETSSISAVGIGCLMDPNTACRDIGSRVFLEIPIGDHQSGASRFWQKKKKKRGGGCSRR